MTPPSRLTPSFLQAIILIGFLIVIGMLVGDSDRLLFTTALIWAMLSMSTWFLLRVSGRSSLGNASFFGAAAYTTGLCSTVWDIDNLWVAVTLGIGVSAVVGLVIGLVSGRLDGFHFLLITLAFAEMLRSVATRWKRLGGEDGMAGIRRPSTWPISVDLTDAGNMMWMTLAFLVACMAVLTMIVRSPFGAAVIAVRDSESRMEALGYRPAGYRIAAVVVSSMIAGVAGVLNAYAIRFISPADLVPLVSAKALLYAVIGGAGLVGAVIAAVAMTFLEDLLSSRFDRWTTVLGLIYIGIAMLSGSPFATVRTWIQTLWARLKRRRATDPEPTYNKPEPTYDKGVGT